MCVKSFYKYHEITLPTIKLTNLNDSDNESIGIKDLPDNLNWKIYFRLTHDKGLSRNIIVFIL